MISKCLQYQGLGLLWIINGNQLDAGSISALGHGLVGMIFMGASVYLGIGEVIKLRRSRK